MKKIISLLILFCIFTILFLVGWQSIVTGSENTFTKYVKKQLSTKVKIVLKETLFIIPELKRNVKTQKKTIENYESIINDVMGYTNISPTPSKKIKSKFMTYSMETYQLPFLNYATWEGKPLGYVDQTKEKIILAVSNGNFFSIDKKLLKSKKIILNNISTNIKNIIKDEDFYAPSTISIRDILIYNNSIFISYTKEQSNNCYNSSILVSDLNIDYLNFSEFFSYTECEIVTIAAWMSGGRMIPFKENKILFSTGAYFNNPLAQDENSLFGKIISIDLETSDYELISMGHRNPQGLYYNKDQDIIVLTEHGPVGGDEINVNLDPSNSIIENYGWPISSYGEPHGGVYKKEEPLYKSHKNYGFIEPIKYYTPSISVSEIINIPQSFSQNFINDFFIATLGYKKQIDEGDMSIHHLRFNKNYNQIVFEDIIPIGGRIRDILLINETNQILLVLENIPALAIVEIIN